MTKGGKGLAGEAAAHYVRVFGVYESVSRGKIDTLYDRSDGRGKVSCILEDGCGTVVEGIFDVYAEGVEGI